MALPPPSLPEPGVGCVGRPPEHPPRPLRPWLRPPGCLASGASGQNRSAGLGDRAWRWGLRLTEAWGPLRAWAETASRQTRPSSLIPRGPGPFRGSHSRPGTELSVWVQLPARWSRPVCSAWGAGPAPPLRSRTGLQASGHPTGGLLRRQKAPTWQGPVLSVAPGLGLERVGPAPVRGAGGAHTSCWDPPSTAWAPVSISQEGGRWQEMQAGGEGWLPVQKPFWVRPANGPPLPGSLHVPAGQRERGVCSP